MKYTVGYQQSDLFKKTLLHYREHFNELYFSWPGIASGRSGNKSQPGIERQLSDDLREYAATGLSMHLLLNGNCYGSQSLSRSFFNQIGNLVDYLLSSVGLSGITTTSPVIAKFLKRNFCDLEIRASVNMEISTTEAMEYLLQEFDGFYLKREFNYDLQRLQDAHNFCTAHGKKLYLLANSGCLSFCPARTFHDNLVSHQDEIAEIDNAFEFHGVCHEFLKDASRRTSLLSRSTFIRPEDIARYEGFCDGVKLATRVSRHSPLILRAYAEGFFKGNLWDLTEPSYTHLFQPEILANDKIPENFWMHRVQADWQEYCNAVQKKATLKMSTE